MSDFTSIICEWMFKRVTGCLVGKHWKQSDKRHDMQIFMVIRRPGTNCTVANITCRVSTGPGEWRDSAGLTVNCLKEVKT